MTKVLEILQLISASVLVILILVQNKGIGFGRVWGGSSVSFTRRGLEKLIFRLTFAITGIFIVISILLTVL